MILKLLVFLAVLLWCTSGWASICGTCSAARDYSACEQLADELCCSEDYPCPEGQRVLFCDSSMPAGCTTLGRGCDQFSVVGCCPGEPDACEDCGAPTAPDPPPACSMGRAGDAWGCVLGAALAALAAWSRRRSRGSR